MNGDPAINGPCDVCGAPGVDVSGRAARLAHLRMTLTVASMPPDVRKRTVRRILDAYREPERRLCPAHMACAACFLESEGLAPCEVCKTAVCPNCRLDALKIDAVGRVVDGPTDEYVCVQCNPPGGGPPSGLLEPSPCGPRVAVFS